jgi:iron complex outermembrane recepter protein
LQIGGQLGGNPNQTARQTSARDRMSRRRQCRTSLPSRGFMPSRRTARDRVASDGTDECVPKSVLVTRPSIWLSIRLRAAAPLTIAAVLVATSSLQAQGVPDTSTLKRLSLEELGRIAVTTVSKLPETVWNTAAAVHVLTHEDIVRSGATSIPDALRLVPGVEVARIDTSRNWVVGIRGFGDQYSKSVLVLIDGRAAYTPLWAGVHWPIQDTLLEDVDRIEVIRGPGGTIWGANAMNGVINIITRSAQASHGVYASAATGNVDNGIVAFRYGGRAGRIDYRMYAKGTSRDPQFHPDGREFDTWSMGQTGFRIDLERGNDHLTLSGDAYRAELGESVRVHTFAPPSSHLVDDPVDLHGANVLANWRRLTTAGSFWSVQAYVDHTYRLGTDFGERTTTFDVDALHRSRAGANHSITWGLGARTSPSRVTQTYSFSNFLPHEHTLNLFSAFVEDAVTLVPGRLTVSGGAKLGHNSYSGLDLQPSGRALWTPTARQSVWAGVTRAVRTPSRVDEDISVSLLLQPNPPTYAVITGNRELESEKNIGLEAGYRHLLKDAFYFDIALFRNRYSGLVDLGAPRPETRTTDGLTYNALVVPWVNGIDGSTSGIEIAPEWMPTKTLRVRGTYSYLDVNLEATAANGLRATLPTLEGGTPRHQVTLQALTTIARGIQIDPVYRYVSARTALGISAYHAADLRIGIPLPRGFEVAIVGQNLLDPRHPEWARDPGPTVEIERSAYVRLIWRR